MGCDRFRRGRGGGGEAAPRCRRRMTHRRMAWWPWMSKAAANVWRSKINKKIGSVGQMRGWSKLLTGPAKKYG
jgi:hypothetical protein